GLGALAGMATAAPGVVFTWFLLAYAVLRFGLEGLRGDPRPELLGLSVNRWMCLIEATGALCLAAHIHGGRDWTVVAVLAAALVAGVVAHWWLDDRRRVLAPAHIGEVAGLAAALVGGPLSAAPDAGTSSRGVVLAASRLDEGAHFSLSFPAGP